MFDKVTSGTVFFYFGQKYAQRSSPTTWGKAFFQAMYF